MQVRRGPRDREVHGHGVNSGQSPVTASRLRNVAPETRSATTQKTSRSSPAATTRGGETALDGAQALRRRVGYPAAPVTNHAISGSGSFASAPGEPADCCPLSPLMSTEK